MDKENEDVGIGAAGVELPPPPPPQEANVSAVRFAKSKDDLPLSCITCFFPGLLFRESNNASFNSSV